MQLLRLRKSLRQSAAVARREDFHHTEDNLLLVVKVIVERCNVDAGSFGNLARRRVIDAFD